MKTGQQHLASLRDGRNVILHGERIPDITVHRAFRNSAAAAAQLYDFQAEAGNTDLMTFQTATGARVSRCWQLPTTYEELVLRRQALTAWAATHFGFMGRSPDHVASSLSGMFMGIDVFESWNPQRAGALRDYYAYARDNDLFLTYSIINPRDAITTRIVDQDATGIIVEGAKLLATSAVMANEVLITSIQPLSKGDEPYALSFVTPMNTPGLQILSRRSYEETASSVFDYPLSSRYDENDAVLYFENAQIPWERVFIAGDVAMCQRQFHATPAHVFQNYQCQIRLMVKIRFLAALARQLAEVQGTAALPQVRETLGQLAAEAASVEAFVLGMEIKGARWNGYFIPDRHMLYAAQVLTQQLYPKIIHTLRELAGGSMIMVPSSVGSVQVEPSAAAANHERVKLFKLAWDAAGSEFASRHTQYEMFYAGASFVTRGHSYRTYDWDSAGDLLARLLASY